MTKTISKLDQNNIAISETFTKDFSYDHIVRMLSNALAQAAYWQDLKDQADGLGVKSVDTVNMAAKT